MKISILRKATKVEIKLTKELQLLIQQGDSDYFRQRAAEALLMDKDLNRAQLYIAIAKAKADESKS